LLKTPKIGNWLLASLLHFGHSLMNSGRWPQAAHALQDLRDWMDALPVVLRQYAWEDEPQMVSLRRDDVWIGCYQHLGLVRGKRDAKTGLGYLQTALSAINRPHHPVVPGNIALKGDLERDLAYLKLKLEDASQSEIRQHLLHAQQSAEASGSPGTQAFTQLAWARLYDRLARSAGEREQAERRRQRQHLEQSIEQALSLIEEEQEDRPMRQTICLVDAAQLFQAHGMPLDKKQIQYAAQLCFTYGYGGQAQELLNVPGIEACLPEEMHRALSNLVLYK
jgi:hypothetical protein